MFMYNFMYIFWYHSYPLSPGPTPPGAISLIICIGPVRPVKGQDERTIKLSALDRTRILTGRLSPDRGTGMESKTRI